MGINGKSRDDRDKEAYIDSTVDTGIDRRVQDLEGNTKLAAILAALGGSSDTTATIYNITLGAVNTEQSLTLPANTKRFILKSRGNAEIKISYLATESGSKYISIPRQGVYEDPNFYQSQTIYFQSPQTGDIVEVITYT